MDLISYDAQPKEPISQRERRAARAYRPHFAEHARNYALMGASDKEIAGFFGVDINDLMIWKNLYPDFASRLESGREMADAQVVAALFKNAVGYTAPAVKHMTARDKDGNVEILEKAYVEHYAPNQASIEFWLTNRQGDKWKKKQQVDSRSMQYVVQFNEVDRNL